MLLCASHTTTGKAANEMSSKQTRLRPCCGCSTDGYQTVSGTRSIPRTGLANATSAAPYSSLDFWQSGVGVVTPHRAQQGLIVTRLLSVIGATGQLAEAIRDAVDTVERFQGQQRDIIIASYTLGDPDQIAEEDEFLLSLNRFNVIASRARAKLIVLVSQDVLNHLAREIEVFAAVKAVESVRRVLLPTLSTNGP